METRVFKRKFYEKMLAWKREKDGSSALMIKGARRVGKSTIAEEFAKNEIAITELGEISDIIKA